LNHVTWYALLLVPKSTIVPRYLVNLAFGGQVVNVFVQVFEEILCTGFEQSLQCRNLPPEARGPGDFFPQLSEGVVDWLSLNMVDFSCLGWWIAQLLSEMGTVTYVFNKIN